MSKPRVGVAGYGVIGQRLADGVALQEDMELVGVVDVAPTLSTRALCEAGMPYDLYVVEAGQKAAFDEVRHPGEPGPWTSCSTRSTSCSTRRPAA